MALQSMNVSSTAVTGDVEILYHANYTAEAVTLDTTAFTDGVCKAGTPITTDGKVDADGSAILGILLSDVSIKRPQGTAVIGGYINTAVAQAHSGKTIAEAQKTALKNVVFK